VLINLAQKKEFSVTDHYRDSVTHIVTGYDTVEKVLPVIKRYMYMYELDC